MKRFLHYKHRCPYRPSNGSIGALMLFIVLVLPRFLKSAVHRLLQIAEYLLCEYIYH